MILRRDVNRDLTHDEVDGNFIEAENLSQKAMDSVDSKLDSLQNTTARYAFDTLQEAQDKWASFSQEEKDELDGKTFVVSTGSDAGEYSWQSSETGGTRFERFPALSNEDLGITIIPSGTNILKEAAEHDISDDTFWEDGWLRSNGTLSISTTNRTTIDYIAAYPGEYDAYLTISGNMAIVFYNEDFRVIGYAHNPTSDPTSYSFNFTAPEDTAWVKFSHTTSLGTNNIKAERLTDYRIVSTQTFDTPESVEKKIIQETGGQEIAVGTNFIEELTNSQLTDETIWGEGFFDASGNIRSSTDNHYSKKYYRLHGSEFNFRGRYNGNGAALFYNENFELIYAYVNPNTGVEFIVDLDLPEDVTYFRTSFFGGDTRLSFIRITNKEKLIVRDYFLPLASGISKTNDTIPVSGLAVGNMVTDIFKLQNPPLPKIPIVSFISDDGRVENLEWFVPMLDEKGVKATFVVITSRLGTSPDSITKEQAVQLHVDGHEIGGHTHTHPPLRDLPLTDVEWELQECAKTILELGITPHTFVHPFGSDSLDTQKIVRKYFKASTEAVFEDSVIDGTCCNTPPIDTFEIKRFPFDASADGVSTLQICKDAVDVAFDNSEWLIFTIHPQYTEYYNENGGVDGAARRQELSDLIDYIQSKEIRIMNVRQAHALWKNPAEIGNVRLDDKYYALGMDGSEEGNFFDLR